MLSLRFRRCLNLDFGFEIVFSFELPPPFGYSLFKS